MVAPVVGTLLITIGVAAAQLAPIDPKYRELWEKSQVFQPRPSFDTTPVTIKVVAVTYRIPRNYLTDLGPELPAIKLAWPGLQPLTKENQECFGSIARGERAGCASFSFRVRGSKGPGPGGWALTNTEKFQNFIKNFPAATQQRGPFGYDVYSIGPESARTEFYRRTDGDIYFNCMFSGEESRNRGGVCNDSFRLDDMNHMQFFFRLRHIEHIPEIEARMRAMMAGFVIGRDELRDK